MHTRPFRTQAMMMGAEREPQRAPQFFMIKSSSEDSVKRSTRDGLWSTTAKNEVLSFFPHIHKHTDQPIHLNTFLPTYLPTQVHATQTQPPTWINICSQFMPGAHSLCPSDDSQQGVQHVISGGAYLLHQKQQAHLWLRGNKSIPYSNLDILSQREQS
jgi:hypothetical protein